MPDIYDEIIAACRQIAASFPLPRFYDSCTKELSYSRRIFATNKLVVRCLEIISGDLQNNLGHGLDHAGKVAIEAGALGLVEWARMPLGGSTRKGIGVLAQMAGLLHDVRRVEEDHARCSAAAAETILDDFPLSRHDKMCIVEAIANHEAFVEPMKVESPVGQVISSVLYDADKFRWGPDNFTVTLWEMLRASRIPVTAAIRRFPQGMAGIARIKGTFRSQAGRMFGPEFIDLGLEIGEKIYRFLKERFADELSSVSPSPDRGIA